MFVEGWPRALEPVVESHILTGYRGCPPAVVVIDEWCGRSCWRPGLPAAVARDKTTRRERLAKGSVAEAHAFGKVLTVVWLKRCGRPFPNASIEWS